MKSKGGQLKSGPLSTLAQVTRRPGSALFAKCQLRRALPLSIAVRHFPFERFWTEKRPGPKSHAVRDERCTEGGRRMTNNTAINQHARQRRLPLDAIAHRHRRHGDDCQLSVRLDAVRPRDRKDVQVETPGDRDRFHIVRLVGNVAGAG